MRPEQKEAYLKRYVELKKKGKSFYPYSIFKDVAASAIILLVLLAFVVAFGVPLDSKADPTNTSYVPRPEWYFMFLFEALKYFPGSIEWVGVVIVPGITLAALVLFPWLDSSPRRGPSRRPLSITLAGLVVVITVFLILRGIQGTPSASAEKLTPAQEAGRAVYQANGCASCHSIQGVGGKVGPDLAGLADRMDAAKITQYTANPKAVNPNAIMRPYVPPLTPTDLDQLTQYLISLKK
ncbi:MAG: c-type cytochrome [Dehalococcoidia bacterium]|nr:c-type cytochrome [Dehalococcoidia bacterium]